MYVYIINAIITSPVDVVIMHTYEEYGELVGV